MGQSDTLFTLGYQAHTARTMLQVLRKYGIKLVVDVRRNPISRKPGFSKTRLASFLSQKGIEYLHYPCFGTPRHIRERYCKQGQIAVALRLYEKYLQRREKCIKSFLKDVSSRQFCLICFESDHNFCHRSVIANKLTEIMKCQAIHLI